MVITYQQGKVQMKTADSMLIRISSLYCKKEGIFVLQDDIVYNEIFWVHNGDSSVRHVGVTADFVVGWLNLSFQQHKDKLMFNYLILLTDGGQIIHFLT